MRKFLARLALKRFAMRYNYDVGFMHYMLETSPAAFFKFASLAKLATHRDAVPKEAFYAAKILGALAEDCGPCTQLAVDMAQEARVPPDQIQAVLRRDLGAMSADTLVAFRFAEALTWRRRDLDHARQALRRRWGEAAVIDLTLAVQVGRIFPMVKAGLGYAKTCQAVQLGDSAIDVVRLAA